MMHRSLVALGSNLGDPRSQIEQAFVALGGIPGSSVTSRSSLHVTQPIGGPAGQADFVNAAAVLETALHPLELLENLQEVEHDFHRRREQRWAARTLDLDLLLYDEEIVERGDLIVPHPRMSFRPFVLVPAVEIAGDWRHPTLQSTLAELHEQLTTADDAVLIYGGEPGDRRTLAERIVSRFAEFQPAAQLSDELWLSVGESRSKTNPRLAVHLGALGEPLREGIPTLSLFKAIEQAAGMEIEAAIQSVWPDCVASSERGRM